jgi:hypothetical protein
MRCIKCGKPNAELKEVIHILAQLREATKTTPLGIVYDIKKISDNEKPYQELTFDLCPKCWLRLREWLLLSDWGVKDA